MEILDKTILNLNNISQYKCKVYSMFTKGFVIELQRGMFLRWNLKESPAMIRKSKKIVVIKEISEAILKNYVYISSEFYEEFLQCLGASTFIGLSFIFAHQGKKKKKQLLLYCMFLGYYLLFPIMGLLIFFRLLRGDCKKEELFNYYHGSGINDVLYQELMKQHYPIGFEMKERTVFLKKHIKGNISEGPWLDLGCGINSRLLDIAVQMDKEIWLVDPNPSAELAYEKEIKGSHGSSVKFINGSGENLPFEDNFFSFIYCGGVIAHIRDPERFILECRRVLKAGGHIFIDESNEMPRIKFMSSYFSIKIREILKVNTEVTDNYIEIPPNNYIANPWGYWGCSTDHFWIFNRDGLKRLLEKYFKACESGGMGSYLCNNGRCQGNPLYYPLNLGSFFDIYIDFINLPKWYLKLLTHIFGDLGIYLYYYYKKE